jgi:hypothetical protein
MDDIKILLGDAKDNFSDEQITLCLKHAKAEVKSYCNRELNEELEVCAQKIAIIKLNRMNTEGLASQGYSGVSENYIDGYPADIMALLNRNRKIKVV